MPMNDDLVVEKVISGGPDLDCLEWLDSQDRWLLLHNDVVVASSIHDHYSYIDRMMELYVDSNNLPSMPPNGEFEVIKVSLAFHIGDKVTFVYEGGDYTGRVAHVQLGSDGHPAYVLENIEPPMLL